MNPPLSGIACFFATSPEARWLKRRFKSHARVWLKPSLLHWGVLPVSAGSAAPSPRSILVVETGMGPKASKRAAQYALGHFPIEEVWIFGLAAGAQKGLKVGDALIATDIGSEETLSDPDLKGGLRTDPTLLNRARRLMESLSVPAHFGPLLTIGRVLHSPEEKLLLGEKFGCLGLEMEAAPIAQEAERRKIPCMEIRWVLDGVEDPLPEINSFVDERGCLRPFTPLFGFLRRPRLFLEIPPFLWKVRTALTAQNRFLQKWLENEKITASFKKETL